MASIVQRGNRYHVVYLYDAEDGKRKQKWESFKTLADAKRRKSEVEYLAADGEPDGSLPAERWRN